MKTDDGCVGLRKTQGKPQRRRNDKGNPQSDYAQCSGLAEMMAPKGSSSSVASDRHFWPSDPKCIFSCLPWAWSRASVFLKFIAKWTRWGRTTVPNSISGTGRFHSLMKTTLRHEFLFPRIERIFPDKSYSWGIFGWFYLCFCFFLLFSFLFFILFF